MLRGLAQFLDHLQRTRRSKAFGHAVQVGAGHRVGTLDFDQVSNSTVAVTIDVKNAEASFPFAAQAMKGPKVLDAQAFPEITFASTSVSRAGDGATVEGNVTIRGVTQPMTLAAQIWRQKDSEPGDLSHLTVRLVGKVKRSAFGATGWSDMVGDEVRLDILARIARQE